MGKRKHSFNTLYTMLFVHEVIEMMSDFVLEHNPTFEHVFSRAVRTDSNSRKSWLD